MRAPVAPRSWKDRLPSLALALAVQAAFLALLVHALVVPHPPPPEPQEVIFLLPRLREPVVIDARTPRPAPSLRGNQPASPQRSGPAPAAPAPIAAPPASEAPASSPAPAAPGRDLILLNPPSGVQDEKRWAEEKARAGKPPTLGVDVGVGVGIVIENPLCKLAWVLMGGGFSCAPNNYVRKTTDKEFQAALDAVNARKRAITPKPKAQPQTPQTPPAPEAPDAPP